MRPAFLLIALVFAARPVAAAPDVQGACMADYLALCGSVQPGDGRVVACMKAHRAQVSIACKVAVLRHIAEKRGLISSEDTP